MRGFGCDEAMAIDNILMRVRPVLTTTPVRWTNLIQALPAELLSEPPAPGEWSARECLQHLVDTERSVFPVRIKAILAGKDFPAFDPDAQGTTPDVNQSLIDLMSEFTRLRSEGLDTLAQVTPGDLPRRARHAELGMVTMSELLHEWAGHDLMHTVQAERALMQPFIRGCGPWQSYFVDHIARQA